MKGHSERPIKYNSFAFTSTSDSEDSDTAMAVEAEIEKNKKVKSRKYEKNSIVEEELAASNESPKRGKKRKIKVEKDGEAREEHNHKEGNNRASSDDDIPKKKRKVKENQIEKQAPVKLEPDSDTASVLTSGKKRKKQRQNTHDSQDSHQSESQEDSYLDLMVKQEQASPATSTIINKKQLQREVFVNGDVSDTAASHALKETKSKKSKKNKLNDDDTSNQNVKKNNKINESDSDVDVKDLIIEEKFDAEETVVEMRHKKTNSITEANTPKIKTSDVKGALSKKTKVNTINSYTSKEFLSDDSSSDESSKVKSSKVNKHNPVRRESSSENSSHESSKAKSNKVNKQSKSSTSSKEKVKEHSTVRRRSKSSDSSSTNQDEVSNKVKPNKTPQRTSKISDLITFEDENESLINEKLHDSSKLSSQLKRFLRVNPNLRPYKPTSESSLLITPDDDIWVIKCPHEIDIKLLKGSHLILDNKCKLKIDGHTYEGSVDEENNRLPILNFENNITLIKNIPLVGTINLRKRIPKPHFIDDNIANNETNFIPLPDTKCRHPLFGVNYKRAIKIPTSVKARLKAVNEEVPNSTERKKKKKHKEQEKQSEEESIIPTKCEPEFESSPQTKSKRKKRKHKQTDDDEEPVLKKAKRVKHDLDAAETWESEKAIAESLFSF